MNEQIEQKIRERAFEIFEFRQQHGMMYIVDRVGNVRKITEQDDWLEAEVEVLHAKRFYEQYHIEGGEE